MKRLLVTGGGGFIGSHLVEELIQRGHKVIVMDLHHQWRSIGAIKGQFELIRGDIRDENCVNKVVDAEVEGILHLAALINVDQSIQSPDIFLSTNVMATANIIEAARRRNIPKFLYMSTAEVYGNVTQGKADESYPTNPRSPYAASKFSAERYLLAYSFTYAHPKIVVIRGFNQYGPRQNAGENGALIAKFIAKLLAGQKIQVHGNGNQTRDYVYVRDTARGIADAFEKDLPSGEVINLATGVCTSTLDIAISICKLARKQPEEYMGFVEDRSGQVLRSCGDFSKAKTLLGWEPSVCFNEGLHATFKWYAENAHKHKINDAKRCSR